MMNAKLIAYYENRLEKVKSMWNEDTATNNMMKERCREYVAQAEADLEAVKNGREW